jgi:HEAT repeat protein
MSTARIAAFMAASLLALSAPRLPAQSAQALSGFTNVPIVVTESFTEDGAPLAESSTRVLPVLQRLFLHAGATLSPSPAGAAFPSGPCIRVTVTGHSVAANYSGATNLHAGAELAIVFVLEKDGKPVVERRFSGSVAPPTIYQSHVTPLRPFNMAVESSPFYPYVLELLDSSYGPGVLVGTLGDASIALSTRLSAAKLLQVKSAPVSEDAFILALRDESPEMRWTSAESLGIIGSVKAGGALRAALKDGSRDVRYMAAWSLGRIRDAQAGPDLAAANGDVDPYVRTAAALALSEIGDPGAPAALLKAMQERKMDRRYMVAAAKKLESMADDPVQSGALAAAVAGLEEANAIDAGAFVEDVRYPALARAAAAALTVMKGPGSMDAMIDSLTNGNDPAFDRVIVDVLGKRGDPRAIDALCRELDASNRDLRDSVRRALDRFRDPRIVTAMMRFILGTDYSGPLDEDLVARAAEVLGKQGDPAAVDTLIAGLKAVYGPDRLRAVIALGVLKDAKAALPLLPLLKDTEPDVALAAVRALGDIGDARAVDPLVRKLSETQQGQALLFVAAQALGKLKARKAAPELIKAMNASSAQLMRLERSDASWEGFCAELGSLGSPDTVRLLIKGLKDKTWSVRAISARALGSLKATEAVKALKAMASAAKEDLYVQLEASKALERIAGSP